MNRDEILTYEFYKEAKELYRGRAYGYSLWAQQVYMLNQIVKAEIEAYYEKINS